MQKLPQIIQFLPHLTIWSVFEVTIKWGYLQNNRHNK